MAAAELAHRAAAALRGGMPAVRVTAMLTGTDQVAGHAAERDAPEWRVLLAAWRLAERSGAPFAPTLDRFCEALRALGRVAERREVLLAGPRATVRLVAVLPPAGLLLAALLGFDPVRALAHPSGFGAAVIGGGLLVLGVRWAAALARRVSQADWVAGWEFELMAIGIGGGGSPQRALRDVVDCADRAGAEWVRLESLTSNGAVQRVLDRAADFGAPLGPALLAEAESERDRARAELERAAERLGVRVLLPLGICVLPAFVLLGVVPVLIAVVGGAFV